MHFTDPQLRAQNTCVNSNHPLSPILESIIDIEDNPTIINRFFDIPLVINFRIVKNYSHLLEKNTRPNH